MLTYESYTGKVELVPEAGVLHGQVLELHDVVTFEGRNAEEVERAFRDSVDDYLEMLLRRT